MDFTRISVFLTIALATGFVRAQPPVEHEFDPAKVLGSDACKKCHAAEVAQWEQTPHALTVDTLHRRPEADAIADRLGLRSVKRNATCVRCHYTERESRGRVRIDSGVSCESCHGPARDWVEIHAEYGPGVTRETETPDARQRRRLASIAAGMNNPSNLYLVARQCFDCHTTPDQELVDVGGHPAGSGDFDLVAWSQGSVRHNFVRSNGATNEPSSLARVRVMYVVGLMTDLEYSLRATAKATAAGTFAKTAAARAATRKQTLWEVQRRLSDPIIAPALDAVATLELKLGNAEAINAAADAISDAAYAFAERADGARLTAIDDLLPPPNAYK
ncbi:Perchlorate reductase subunit gamma precursor [Botrimarina colliarenosi]|uniref:Perchlorate reductase subunit gamma n=1 Tax=Botrimarina colliarenosi TaxID=2528001 RepID=A0A5C6ABV2_9BACT|nr:cytochrome c family protein [Botrimarina colliarenosi]TWT96890.1 Perchlorate reductase subunit gamma precursor [Botrimarina colliarenosi]